MIGRLRHRVTFQKPLKTEDGEGGFVLSWVDHVTVWAHLEALGGKEAMEADKLTSIADYRVTIRYREDITPDMRLVWRGRKFHILSIKPDEKERYLTVSVKETHDEGTY